MAGIEELKTALIEFNNEFLGPSLKPFEPSELYDIDRDWPKQWPNADSPGVYFFLSSELDVLWIGKASNKNLIGSRIGTFLSADSKKPWRRENDPIPEAQYIASIPIPKEHAFMAPALKEFLITRLQPSRNKIGTGN